MQKIVPNFWFDHNAEDAVTFYLSVFPDSKIIATLNYPNTTKKDGAQYRVSKISLFL
jgi:predicted 3-demethylubiquinone-9 3-methyltransferase (glyoxalase superfamily)